jgi:agmatine deiminase
MITDHQTNKVYFSSLLPAQYREAMGRIEKILLKHRVQYGFLHGAQDIWCRDYMPVQVSESDFVQFRYNSTYLQPKKYAALKTDPEEVLEWRHFNALRSEIILDGGNVVRGEDQVLISERIYRDNPGWNRNELIIEVERLLRAEVIMVPTVPYDLTGHADGMVRFLAKNRILVNNRNQDKKWAARLEKMLSGRGFEFIDVPWFTDPDTRAKDSAIGIYLNYLEIGNLILLPVFASEELIEAEGQMVSETDHRVIYQFHELFPNHMIEPVQINEVGKRGGLMNCISWTIKQPDL